MVSGVSNWAVMLAFVSLGLNDQAKLLFCVLVVMLSSNPCIVQLISVNLVG